MEASSFEALTARLLLHPLASASCSVGIVTIVIATIPNKATAATMAILRMLCYSF